MRGSITRVSRKEGSGCILAEDGKEVHFDRSGVGRNDVGDLRVGRWVEFELQYGFEPVACHKHQVFAQRRRSVDWIGTQRRLPICPSVKNLRFSWKIGRELSEECAEP